MKNKSLFPDIVIKKDFINLLQNNEQHEKFYKSIISSEDFLKRIAKDFIEKKKYGNNKGI